MSVYHVKRRSAFARLHSSGYVRQAGGRQVGYVRRAWTAERSGGWNNVWPPAERILAMVGLTAHCIAATPQNWHGAGSERATAGRACCASDGKPPSACRAATIAAIFGIWGRTTRNSAGSG